MIFIVMDNGNDPPARIEISENKDGKLLSELEWPIVGSLHVYINVTIEQLLHSGSCKNFSS